MLRSWRPEIVARVLDIRNLCLSPDGLLLEGLLEGWLLRLCWQEGGLVRGKWLAPLVLSGLVPYLRGLDRRLVPDLRRMGEWRSVGKLGCGEWLERSAVGGEAVLLLGGLALSEGGVYAVRGEGVWRVTLLRVVVSVVRLNGLLRPVGVCGLRQRVGVLSRELLQGGAWLPPILAPAVVHVRLV